MEDNKILESRKGILYSPPARLETKKKVYSQAILEKIPHDTDDKIDIRLKIGRYNIFGGLETKDPKSELTLSDVEFKNLIAYLEKYYKPLELGVENFIPIGTPQSLLLLKEFKSLVNSDEEIAKQLKRAVFSVIILY